MTEKPLFDIHDNYLPQGFYYYDIKKYTQYNTAIGYVISDTIFSTYEFKMFTVIKIMAKAMSKLTRQTDYDYNITNMKKTTFLIVGRHAVTEALRNPQRKVHRLFITEDALKKLNRDNQSENLVKKQKINVIRK